MEQPQQDDRILKTSAALLGGLTRDVANLSQRLDHHAAEVKEQLQSHYQAHRDSAHLHEEGAARAREAELRIWTGIEVLQANHAEIVGQLREIHERLPDNTRERLAAAEGAVRWLKGGGVLLFGMLASATAAAAALIGSLVQAMGGGSKPPPPAGT